MRKVITVLAILTALFVAGCSCSDILDTMTVEQAQERCQGKAQPDHCLKDLGIENLNPLICNQIASNGPKSKCLLYVAKGLMDPALCRAMPVGGGAYSAEECYYQVALSAHDPRICSSLDPMTTYPKTDISGKAFDYNDCMKGASKNAKETFKCGDSNQPCCVMGCNDRTLTCDSTYRCVPCGNPGQVCCIGSCTAALCQDGMCVSCGGAGEACCTGNTCTAEGYACYQGSCKQVVV